MAGTGVDRYRRKPTGVRRKPWRDIPVNLNGPALLEIVESRLDPESGEVVDITVADRIVAYVAGGCMFGEAARSMGVMKPQWTTIMAECRAAEAKQAMRDAGIHEESTGRLPVLKQRERVLVDFKRRLDKAWAQATVRDVAAEGKLARGEFTAEVVTTKKTRNDTGELVVVEETSRVQQILPNLPAIQHRLRVREPDTWGAKEGQIEVITPGDHGGVRPPPLDEVLDQLAERIAVRQAKIAARAQEAAAAIGAGDDITDAEIVEDEPDSDVSDTATG